MSSCAERKRDGMRTSLFEDMFFRDLITRERKRADRSGLAMAMLLVGLRDSRDEQDPALLSRVAETLASVKPDLGIVGWFEQGAILGLIVPDLDGENLGGLCERLESAFRQEITEQFNGDLAQRLLIRFSVYPEPQKSGSEEIQAADPLLYPELLVQQDRAILFHVMKRSLDILGSLALLLILSPVLLAVAGLVKLSSPGPVLFRQVRVGQWLRPFTMSKFRSMSVNADHGLHHDYVSWFITSSDKTQELNKNNIFKLTDDPRITPIGQFLRKTSLDELPQLWNVLIGDMSLVGPRPPLFYELQKYKPWHRHRVMDAKPGITGLWQVTGRSRTTFDEMVRLDLRYARQQSLWADIKILLATPAAVIKGKGAH
jgi:lipopolysaccharide/colanic/teichoic acid biosynthesis glycosyltransferase